MRIDLEEDDIRKGLLGLVVALLEIMIDALKHQAVRRMEGGSLTDSEIERLGKALKGIDDAVEGMKEDFGIKETVRSVKNSLDDTLNNLVTTPFEGTPAE